MANYNVDLHYIYSTISIVFSRMELVRSLRCSNRYGEYELEAPKLRVKSVKTRTGSGVKMQRLQYTSQLDHRKSVRNREFGCASAILPTAGSNIAGNSNGYVNDIHDRHGALEA